LLLLIFPHNDKLTSAFSGPRRNRPSIRRLVKRLVRNSNGIYEYCGLYSKPTIDLWRHKNALMASSLACLQCGPLSFYDYL